MIQPHHVAHWYPTAAYLYILWLDALALAWEYLRRHPDYRLDWLRHHRRPPAAQQAALRWGLRLLEDPALDARDAHPAWLPGHAAVVQLHPDADPPPDAAVFAFWRIPGHKQLLHDGKGLALIARSPGHCARFALAPGLEDGMAVAHAHRGGAAARAHAPVPDAALAHAMLRPPPAALLELHTLQALDATLAGASLRKVAEGLFGVDAVAADWHADNALRARVRRLVRRGDALMRGGYRRLAQLPPSPLPQGGRFTPPAKTSLNGKPRFLETDSIRSRCVTGLCRPMEVHTMRPAPLRPAAAAVAAPAQPQRYLTNDEAAEYLRLSPRTLEKQRVIGGGPKFRKFGRRVMYAVTDLDAWADARSFDATSDPEYAERHAGDYRDRR